MIKRLLKCLLVVMLIFAAVPSAVSADSADDIEETRGAVRTFDDDRVYNGLTFHIYGQYEVSGGVATNINLSAYMVSGGYYVNYVIPVQSGSRVELWVGYMANGNNTSQLWAYFYL